jgi:hypothetical protein
MVVGMKVTFTLKKKLPQEELRGLLGQLVGVYKGVPGLKEKYFFEDLASGESGGIYVFESQETLDKYIGSEVWKNVVEANAVADPKIEKFVIAASLSGGVLL